MSRPKKKKSSASNSNRGKNALATAAATESYRHPTAESPLRPEVGTQAQRLDELKVPPGNRLEALNFSGLMK